MTADSTEATPIGRYLVDGLIGEGTMAEVYKAYDPEIDRTVAIKVLKDALCADEDHVNRFLREARAAAAISHPNIVTIFDVGRAGRRPYVAMEFLEEPTLGDLRARHGKLPLKRIVSIGIQLAQALDYAHRLGIVHCNLKPANVLAVRGSEAIKVTGFGFARAGAGQGAPCYMSPEQIAGDKVDGRSDLFSVGAILYELFTGARAFGAEIGQHDPEPIRKAAPDLPVGLQRIVTRLLGRKPEKRYQTGGEVAEALQRELNVLLEQEQEAAANRYLPSKLRWAAIGGGVMAVLMIAAAFAAFRFQERAIEDRELDAGSSLARFVATESAMPLLSEDWVRLETLVRDAGERGAFAYLTVVDHDGTVRAASDAALQGRRYAAPRDMRVLKQAPDVVASAVELPDGAGMFDFDTAILFQNKEVGRVHMGLSRERLDSAMTTARMVVAGIAVLAVVAVMLLLYVFGGTLVRPVRRLRQAMLAVAAGDVDQRIPETRRDEMGDLFNSFNRMAKSLGASPSSRRNKAFIESDPFNENEPLADKPEDPRPAARSRGKS